MKSISLAVTITKDNKWAAPYVDVVNTFYGRPEIPIGTVRNGKTPESNPMIQVPSERRRPDGSFVYPHRILDGAQAPEAVSLLRQTLAKQMDGSVVIVQVGFSTNLARLLETKADAASPDDGPTLVRKKVRLLSVMAGNFADGKSEFNLAKDVPAAVKLFRDWPTPIVVSGFEIGAALPFPAQRVEHDFAYVQDHPVAEAYRSYMKMPYDRPDVGPDGSALRGASGREVFLTLTAWNDHCSARRQFPLRAVSQRKSSLPDSQG